MELELSRLLAVVPSENLSFHAADAFIKIYDLARHELTIKFDPQGVADAIARTVQIVASWFSLIKGSKIDRSAVESFEALMKYLSACPESVAVKVCEAADAAASAWALSLGRCQRHAEAREILLIKRRYAARLNNSAFVEATVCAMAGDGAHAERILLEADDKRSYQLFAHLRLSGDGMRTLPLAARTSILESTHIRSKCWRELNLQGASLAALGNLEAAKDCFMAALKSAPRALEPMFNLAALYWSTKAMPEALRLLRFVLKHTSNSSDITESGDLLRGKGIPCTSSILWAIARAAAAIGDWPVALSALERLDPCPGAPALAFPEPFSQHAHSESSLVSPVRVRRLHSRALLGANRAADALASSQEALATWAAGDSSLRMLAADALISLGAQLATDERLRSLLDDPRQVPSAHSDGAQVREWKKSRTDGTSSLSVTRERSVHEARVDAGSVVCSLNNRALVCAARGEAVNACRLLRSAVLSSAPGQHVPAMNLTLLLWRENRREDACDVWLGRRFATRLASLNSEMKVRELIAETEHERQKMTPVLDSSHDSVIDSLKINMVDLFVLRKHLERVTKS